MSREPGPELNIDLTKFGRAEANCGVSGKAESFARNAKYLVQSPIEVLVVKKRKGISARREVDEPNGLYVRRHRSPDGLGIIGAIREMIGLPSQAHMDQSACVAQTFDLDFKACRLKRARGPLRCLGEEGLPYKKKEKNW